MTQDQHHPLLCSVVQLRLRDFARRPVAEQARMGAQLEAVLATLLPDLPAARRIVLQGNGTAAVAVLDDPLAALRLGERALRANQIGLGLSVGIDHGPVEVVSSGPGESLSGDAMSSAALMANFASETGLLATRGFRTALAQVAPGAHYALAPAGNFSDAGLRTYQAFALDSRALERRRWRYALIALTTALVLVGAAAALRQWAPQRPQPLAAWWDALTTETVNYIKPKVQRERR